MKYQVIVDYQGRLFKSKITELSEEEVGAMRDDILEKASQSPYFSFTDEYGEIFIFPQDIVQQSILSLKPVRENDE